MYFHYVIIDVLIKQLLMHKGTEFYPTVIFIFKAEGLYFGQHHCSYGFVCVLSLRREK